MDKVDGKPVEFPFLRLLDTEFNPTTHVRMVGVRGTERTAYSITGKTSDGISNFPIQFRRWTRGAPLLAENGLVIGVVRGNSSENAAQNLATPVWHVIG